MAATTTYALALSPEERARYRMMASIAHADERDAWSAAGILPGATVADVGCGPGAVLRRLAEAVGPLGRADGVDVADEAVAAAAAEVGDLPQAAVHRGEAGATGLPTGAYDVVMCRHVLAHNGGHEQRIVAHLADLARPGGAVYLVDVDAPSAWIEPQDPDLADLTERYRRFQSGRGNDMAVGRRLGVLLAGAGLAVERYTCGGSVLRLPVGVRPPAWAAREVMVAAGVATVADVTRWEAALLRADGAAVRPWGALPMCVAVGRAV
ncbi:methyltransferase domain-containing protein [Pseudonocardia sp.]|uniref:methyltransferase domain-containing protein n=1 Tax=Pseudonocardia sp. TaxID=60912 RepID=UPI003D0BA0C0